MWRVLSSSSKAFERLPRSLPWVCRMEFPQALKGHWNLHCASCLHRIQTYTGSPENHSPHSAFWHFEISMFMRATYGLFLLKRRFTRWDWLKGKIAWSISILAVTGRCFVKSRIIILSVRLLSVVYSFTSTTGGNAISIFQFHLLRDLILCYITYYL